MRSTVTLLVAPGFALAVLVACDTADSAAEAGAGAVPDASDASDSATSDAAPDAAPDAPTDTAPDGSGAPAEPFAELVAAGLNRYLGAAQPVAESTDGSGHTTYEFAFEDGPGCIYGGTFRAATRTTGSSDLLIFLQGGGACWADFCFAIDSAPPGIPSLDVLDVDKPTNPFRDWNVLYLPYCDGSLFAGDVDIDDNDDGTIDRYHRGLRNLSAALDLVPRVFPDVERIMIAGSSGGGYGTLVAAPLMRIAFPDKELLVFNDAGVGLGKADVPSFIEGIVEEWNIRWAVPESCETCLVNGHLTPLIPWALERDPELRVAVFSATGDSIIGTLFLQVGAVAFEAALRDQLGQIEGRFPGRFGAFVIEGGTHTTLLGDLRGFLGEGASDSPLGDAIDLGGIDRSEVDGVTVAEWIEQMLGDDPEWGSRIVE
jgi:hypothetical protein